MVTNSRDNRSFRADLVVIVGPACLEHFVHCWLYRSCCCCFSFNTFSVFFSFFRWVSRCLALECSLPPVTNTIESILRHYALAIEVIRFFQRIKRQIPWKYVEQYNWKVSTYHQFYDFCCCCCCCSYFVNHNFRCLIFVRIFCCLVRAWNDLSACIYGNACV